MLAGMALINFIYIFPNDKKSFRHLSIILCMSSVLQILHTTPIMTPSLCQCSVFLLFLAWMVDTVWHFNENAQWVCSSLEYRHVTLLHWIIQALSFPLCIFKALDNDEFNRQSHMSGDGGFDLWNAAGVTSICLLSCFTFCLCFLQCCYTPLPPSALDGWRAEDRGRKRDRVRGIASLKP